MTDATERAPREAACLVDSGRYDAAADRHWPEVAASQFVDEERRGFVGERGLSAGRGLE